MRVLIISWEYPPHIEGGLGRHVAELTPALAQQGLAIHLVTPAYESTVRQFQSQSQASPVTSNQLPPAVVTTENGIVVHRVRVSSERFMGTIYERVGEVNKTLEEYLNQIKEQYGPWDLAHIHDWLTGFAGIALRQSLQMPLVATIHATERGRVRGHLSNDLQRAIDAAERRLVHEADRVIVCSHYMSKELQSFFQVPPARLDIVPNGVNIAALESNSSNQLDVFRAKYARPHEKIVFTISRLVYEKGVHKLVEATPQILTNCPQARIIIAGKGPEADNLQRQAEHLGVADKIDFVGFISNQERNRFFRVADCAVFPSLYEPFGIVALEAMALECPVVVSDVGGFSEVVTHQETGITIYPDDADSVAWGVSRALTHPIWARRHAIKARKAVEGLFNWTRVARLTKEVYRRALEPPSPR